MYTSQSLPILPRLLPVHIPYLGVAGTATEAVVVQWGRVVSALYSLYGLVVQLLQTAGVFGGGGGFMLRGLDRRSPEGAAPLPREVRRAVFVIRGF